MNSYFDQVQSEIGTAVRAGRHLPWYKRVRPTGRTRAPAVVLAALVLAAPAVAAVTNWFGFGEPLYFDNHSSPSSGLGRSLTPTSQLTSLRVADPRGGPPWGLRLVRTTRGDVCLQFGRVEDDQLGALGIDGAWNDDHEFHPFPKAFTGGWGLECGTTDAAGHAFLNVAWSGIAASANPDVSTNGPEASGCQTPRYTTSKLQRVQRKDPSLWGDRNGVSPGTCPPGTARMVFMGLLGPDATSITYEAPDGSLEREATGGDDGAYLLVVPLNQRTCNLYYGGPQGGLGTCGDSVGGGADSASPGPHTPIRAIHYRGGRTCQAAPSAKLLASYESLLRRLLPTIRRSGYATNPNLRAKIKSAMARFAAAHNMSTTQLGDEISGTCPAVGYVAPTEKHLTRAEVASPITVGHITSGGLNAGTTISFTARQPVKSSDSWYEVATTGPAVCEADGDGPIGYGNVRAGQRLTRQIGVSGDCRGTIHGEVGYMQSGGPTNAESAGSGGTPGRDGSIIVGRFKFTMH